MLKNPWGLLHGDRERPVRVENVPSGLACNCNCPTPGCGARFVAVHCKPPRQSHFRHYDAEDCGASYESAVHLLAKSILEREKQIMLPYLDVFTSRKIAKVNTFAVKERLVNRQSFQFDRAELEVWMDGRIPDVVLWKRDAKGIDRKLLVEIVVSHDISDDKMWWLQENQLATVKVYLSWANQAITEEQLKQCLIRGRDSWGGNIVHWAYHPRLEATQQAVDEYYLESLQDGTNGPNMSLKNRGQRKLSVAVTKNQQAQVDVHLTERKRQSDSVQRTLFE